MRLPKLLSLSLFCIVTCCVSSYADPTPVSAPPTPLVTGNGFGIVNYSLTDFALTTFFAHPYQFMRQDPNDPLAEGVPTTNFIQSLGWASETDLTPAKVKYQNESHVINVNDGSYYFMPFGLKRAALVTLAAKAQCLKVRWAQKVVAQQAMGDKNNSQLLLNFDGVPESLLVASLTNGTPAVFDANGCLQGSDGWIFVSLEDPKDAAAAIRDIAHWRAGLSSQQLLRRELRQMEAWRVPASVHFRSEKERKLYRQSETILRVAQSREPNRPGRNNNGLILASLPPGMWFVSWVRDMSYSTVALIRMGHQAEARRAVMAYFNAQPIGKEQDQVGGYPYQVSVVRYFGDGSEEPFFTMEGGWNIEYDNWGNVLWVLSEYVNHYHDTSILTEKTYRGRVYDVARKYIVRPILGNMENTANAGEIMIADTSIWENYQWDKQHFAFSTAAVINGLRSFATLSPLMGDWKTYSLLRRHVRRLQRGFNASYIYDGFITGTRERTYVELYDSSVLETVNYGVVTNRPIIEKTIREMENLRMVSGGFRRVRGDTNYQQQEFLYSNFSLARNYLRLGVPEKGYPLLDEMVGKAIDDHGLIPEMYVSNVNDQFVGKIGDPTGAIPMVGYGAGYYIIYMLER